MEGDLKGMEAESTSEESEEEDDVEKPADKA